jgi:hypothetical protein
MLVVLVEVGMLVMPVEVGSLAAVDDPSLTVVVIVSLVVVAQVDAQVDASLSVGPTYIGLVTMQPPSARSPTITPPRFPWIPRVIAALYQDPRRASVRAPARGRPIGAAPG